jgi:hypothetical protein
MLSRWADEFCPFFIWGRSLFLLQCQGAAMGVYRDLKEALEQEFYTQCIAQALERARVQKRESAQAVTRRTGEVEQSLAEILGAEGTLLGLKGRIEAALP